MQRLSCFSSNLSVIIILILALIQTGCVDDAPLTEPPKILTNLSEGDAFERGSLVIIHVDIEDEQAGIIEEVRIYIDSREVSVVCEFPCYFEWASQDEEKGYHIVKLTSSDSKGNSHEDVYNIRLYDMKRQRCPGCETVTDWDGNSYPTIQTGGAPLKDLC